jgi:hypothetical protein
MRVLSFRPLSARALILVFSAVAASSSQAQTQRLAESGYGLNMLVTYKDSSSFSNFVGGVELNSFLGATTFYNAGYTGTRTTIANIEGGLAYTGHEMTSKVSQVFSGVGALTGTAAVTAHATNTTSMAAGYNPANPYNTTVGDPGGSYSTGIAYGAKLWTGNIATSISGDSFGFTTNSMFSTYYKALIGGIGGQTADIATSSWGGTGSRNNSAGNTTDALAIDAIVSASHKLICVAAGNNGLASGNAVINAPTSPASGNNALVVGASGINGAPTGVPSFTKRADFSAAGPSAALIALDGHGGIVLNETIAQRARVDILAPGQGIIGADSTGPGYYGGGDGTSYATPIVAGGASLIMDAGKALGYSSVTDNRVVTAILQTSADKLAGWTNNATVGSDGVNRTTQALDFEQGAGQMDLTKAFNVLTGGTHDVTGTGGGVVAAKGWDYGELSLGGSNDYLLSGTGYLATNTNFTATLRFDSGATYGAVNANGTLTSTDNLQFQYLSNFSLQLLKVTLNPTGAILTSTLMAESDALYITSEHLNYNINEAGYYVLRVNYLNDTYDLTGHGAIGYGLAWSGTSQTRAVPEPASVAALGLGALAVLRRRNKRA